MPAPNSRAWNASGSRRARSAAAQPRSIDRQPGDDGYRTGKRPHRARHRVSTTQDPHLRRPRGRRHGASPRGARPAEPQCAAHPGRQTNRRTDIAIMLTPIA
jgi:hypothetical protein